MNMCHLASKTHKNQDFSCLFSERFNIKYKLSEVSLKSASTAPCPIGLLSPNVKPHIVIF